jgi:ABC-type antimicrobial peptide transport system permease subunit
VIGTLVTVSLPFVLIFYAKPGSYVEFWTLFGASNQLLAALTLLSISLLGGWVPARRAAMLDPLAAIRRD